MIVTLYAIADPGHRELLSVTAHSDDSLMAGETPDMIRSTRMG